MKGSAAMKRKTCIRKSILQDKSLYLMILPGFLLVLIFSYLPLLGLRLAFFRFDYASGLWGGKFVGLRYFRSFFHDPYCGRLIRNTFLLSLYTLLFSFPIPIIYAMMANEISNRYFKKFCQSVSLMPYFISTVVIVGIMMKLFSGSGVINMLFRKVGLEEQIFFSDKRWFRPLYVISEIWTNTGYNSVIYIAVLASVNQQLYEAAMIDGANRWQKAIHITLPALMPTVRVLLIMALGNLMRVGFNKVFLMSTPVVYETADIIETYVYRRGLINNDYSYSTAVGLFNSMISFVVVVLANFVSKKVSQEGLF